MSIFIKYHLNYRKHLVSTPEQRSKYLSLFPMPEDINTAYIQGSDVNDSASMFKEIILNTKKQTSKLARTLNAYNLEITCKNVHKFWHDNVQYKLETAGIEQLKQPLRLFLDGMIGGDSIGFSMAVSQTLLNCGITNYLRFVKTEQESDYGHIYIVVPKDQKNLNLYDNTKPDYYTIDCVHNDGFNVEKPFVHNIDFILTAQELLNVETEESLPKTSMGDFKHALAKSLSYN